MQKIKIGTRGSKLALWQAEYIAAQLKKSHLDTELVIIETKGDKNLDVSMAKIGGKGIFTEEIEEQLRTGSIDIAVHSAKDLQSKLGEDFQVIAFTEREKVNDVLVSFKENISLNDQLVVGTSSTRRIATLKYHYPHIKTREVRGNLQTRLKKMEDGMCDALILAFAGIHRMGYEDLIREYLPVDIFTPAVGQGSLAIEAHVNIDEELKSQIRQAVNDERTERLVLGERAYLRVLEGGCSIPAFALATPESHETMNITAGIYSLDGKQLVRKSIAGAYVDNEALGKELAREVLEDQGAGILREIKKELNK